MTIDHVIDIYMDIVPHRSRRLFSEFLKRGYEYTTLSQVDHDLRHRVNDAKIMLGMLITLFDDLADNPHYFNPQLLQFLYQLGGYEKQYESTEFSTQETQIISLTNYLINNIKDILKNLPHWHQLQKIFLFDIEQIYLANRYAELLTAYPWLSNTTEAKLYGPYNMGMAATGMIDLMATKNIYLDELGQCRAVFLQAQRLGRIGNVLTTYEREQQEQDHTNEMAIYCKENHESLQDYSRALEREHERGILSIRNMRLKNFNTIDYAQGIEQLFALHISMKGVI